VGVAGGACVFLLREAVFRAVLRAPPFFAAVFFFGAADFLVVFFAVFFFAAMQNPPLSWLPAPKGGGALHSDTVTECLTQMVKASCVCVNAW
jgi:hypothetical protein